MLEMEKEYILQVKNDKRWEDTDIFIPVNRFEDKDDICFFISSTQISIIKDYERNPIRLTRPVINNEEIKHFEVKQFEAWSIYRNNQVLCINPNSNYIQYTIPANEILGN